MKLMNPKIEEIMNNFDFEKVYRIMKFLDWEWSCVNRVPNVKELKATARKLLEDLDSVQSEYIGTGGFVAEDYGGNYRLTFQVEDWNSEAADGYAS